MVATATGSATSLMVVGSAGHGCRSIRDGRSAWLGGETALGLPGPARGAASDHGPPPGARPAGRRGPPAPVAAYPRAPAAPVTRLAGAGLGPPGGTGPAATATAYPPAPAVPVTGSAVPAARN